MRMGLLGSILIGLASASWVMAQPGDPSCVPAVFPENTTAFTREGITDNAFSTECSDECQSCFWMNLEYLYWWLRDAPLPPLITTSNPPSPNFINSVGILGRPNTEIVFGGQDVSIKDVNGGRAFLGFWFNADHNFGCEIGYFGLEQVRTTVAEASDLMGDPVLARPVINARTNQETSLLVAFADQFAGEIGATYMTTLFGAEANAVWSPWSSYFKYQDFLIGGRYLDLTEELGIAQVSALLPQGRSGFLGQTIAPPAVFSISDRFLTHNRFAGGQIGFRGQYDYNLAYFRLIGKLAAGVNEETVRINGATSLGTGRQLITVPGGLLALASNIGDYKRREFSLVPECEVTLGFRITRHIDVHIGYSFLYWTNVTRPIQAMDRTINPTLLPTSTQFGNLLGAARPSFNFQQTDFWAHGINVGLGFEY